MDFKDTFIVRLGDDPRLDVSLMEIEFKYSERLVKVLQRTYSLEQQSFMKNKEEELVYAWYIFRNNSSKWAYAPLIVPKPGKERFRFAVNLRSASSQTKKTDWPMTNADPMMSKLTDSNIFSIWISYMAINTSIYLKNILISSCFTLRSAYTRQTVSFTVRPMRCTTFSLRWNRFLVTSTYWYIWMLCFDTHMELLSLFRNFAKSFLSAAKRA